MHHQTKEYKNAFKLHIVPEQKYNIFENLLQYIALIRNFRIVDDVHTAHTYV